MKGVEIEIKVIPKFRENKRINIFLSFWLSDTKTRYVNSEQEYLAIVRCLNKVKWFVIGSRFSTIIYSDYYVLSDIFNKRDNTKAWINTWLNWLSEFDLKIAHRSSQDQHVSLVDKLSQMSTHYLSSPIEEKIPKYMPVRIITLIKVESKLFSILDIQIDEKYKKYQDLPIYTNLIKYL